MSIELNLVEAVKLVVTGDVRYINKSWDYQSIKHELGRECSDVS